MKIQKLGHLCLLLFCCLMAACSDSNDEPTKKGEEPKPLSKEIKITGIEEAYSVKLGNKLMIAPKIENPSNLKLTYEWGINYSKVGDAASLNYECTTPGKYSGYVKVQTEEGTAQIKEFLLYVYSDYDQGLLLYTETDGQARLGYKSLNELEIPAVADVFAENNPGLQLGKEPLALAWTGEGKTNLVTFDDNEGTEVVLASGNPQKVYLLDATTMKVKTEVAYNGEGTFAPNVAYAPYGSQNFLWNKDHQVVYFVGGGRDYLMTAEHQFIVGKRRHQIPSYAKIADMNCTLITNPMDMVRVYFDTATHHLIYIGGIRGMVESKIACNVSPMALLACSGHYADANADHRYEPGQLLFVGHNGGNVSIYHFAPAANKAEEVLISETSASGHIASTDALGVNPIKPFLYYGNKKGEIFIYNYEGRNFSDKAYASLGEEYDIRKIVFNPYNPSQMYVAAQNTKAAANESATIFVLDVSSNATAKVLYTGSKLGGTIRNLIYKGNGKEMQPRK
ncbi:PKD-like domain-containing protein [Prevotella sp. HUN102]|uniref:PKD-like domain-containing protein n=1 Tax=Prevotella sp. HUN102 TaxID=1392486 RepID=UPI00048FC70B|nr:PKD-like domain-containing protein [Prevotella sp. HUN102]